MSQLSHFSLLNSTYCFLKNKKNIKNKISIVKLLKTTHVLHFIKIKLIINNKLLPLEMT